MPTWLIQIIVLLIIQLIIALLTSHPKQPKPPAADPLENPTIDAGRPIPRLWGTMWQEDSNILWYGDKQITFKKVKM